MAASSSIAPGATITRISRPACIAYTLSTPLCRVAICSRSRSRLTYCSSDSPRAPGRAPGQRVGGLDDHGLDRLRLDLVVVRFHRVGHRLGLAVLAGQLAADQSVRPLDLVGHGLADVVQQRGSTGGLRAGPQLLGHHRGQLRDLDRVGQDVLPVARAEPEASERLRQLGMHALHAGLEHGLLTHLDDAVLELGLRLVVHLLDAGRVDAAVLEQLLEGQPARSPAGRRRSPTARPHRACRR